MVVLPSSFRSADASGEQAVHPRTCVLRSAASSWSGRLGAEHGGGVLLCFEGGWTLSSGVALVKPGPRERPRGQQSPSEPLGAGDGCLDHTARFKTLC